MNDDLLSPEYHEEASLHVWRPTSDNTALPAVLSSLEVEELYEITRLEEVVVLNLCNAPDSFRCLTCL